MFYIKISFEDIKKYNLKEDYISAFNQLNKSCSNYSSLSFAIYEKDDINKLKEFNINFSQIKKIFDLFIFSHKYYNDYILENLFSLNNLENNLTSLGLIICNISDLDPNIFEKINNFKKLEKLHLNVFHFKKTCILTLQNLKDLFLSNCHFLSLEKVNFSKIIKLGLYNNKNLNISNKLNLPELEELEIGGYTDQRSNDIIDFKSLIKIKSLKDDPGYYIYPGYYRDGVPKNVPNDEDITFLKNILLLKNIEKVNFDIYKINNENLAKIEGENTSLKELQLNWYSKTDNCILYSLQNKFPNLSTLIVEYTLCESEKQKVSLEITEKPNSKINKIYIIDLKIDTKLHCCPYKDLVEIKLKISNKVINNYKHILPIFDGGCKTIFKNLKTLHFEYEYPDIDSDIFKNIYGNINNMTNLKDLKLQFNLKYIEKELYENFIRKLISMELNNIHIYYRYDKKIFSYYLKKDFIELKCEVNYHFEKIYIQKFNENNFK